MAHYTEDAALAVHGIDSSYGLAYLRDEVYLLSVCLRCATIIVAPDAVSRIAYREHIDWTAAACCDLPLVVY